MTPVESVCCVTSAEGFRSETGRVTFVRVTLDSGHEFLVRPEGAPQIGQYVDVVVTPRVTAPQVLR